MRKSLCNLLVAGWVTVLTFSYVRVAMAQQDAMNALGDFAERMCKDVPLTGQTTDDVLSGGATAELSGLFRKLASFGIHLDASHKEEHYSNVLRKDLPQVLANTSDCKLRVLELMHRDFFGQPESNWMTYDELSVTNDTKGKQQFYPSIIDGHCDGNVEKYKAQWKPFPPGTSAYYTWWGMHKELFDQRNNYYVSNGYKLLTENTFADCAGEYTYWATWLKID